VTFYSETRCRNAIIAETTLTSQAELPEIWRTNKTKIDFEVVSAHRLYTLHYNDAPITHCRPTEKKKRHRLIVSIQ